MRLPLAIALLLSCAACSQDGAPVEEVAEVAEEIVAPASPAPLAMGPWAPQDTCSQVAGADGFRVRLAAAIEARDVEALVALAAEDVKLDFGGGAGSAELRRRLGDIGLGLWKELDALMTLGCSANAQGGITIPWIFDQDLGGADPFTTLLVTDEDVPLLERPDPASATLATISWDLVETASFDPALQWQRVEAPEETVGFIATDKLRSPLGYRLTASSRNGRWRITSFVAGD